MGGGGTRPWVLGSLSHHKHVRLYTYPAPSPGSSERKAACSTRKLRQELFNPTEEGCSAPETAKGVMCDRHAFDPWFSC